MGRRGPSPTPTKLRIRRGNPRRRPINDAEPKPEEGVPDCPEWLDKDSRKSWDDVVPKLAAMDVITRIDEMALVALVKTWTRWRKAEQFIDKNGEVYTLKGEDGKAKYVQQFPQVSIARNQLQLLNRMFQEFGLTPSSRTRLRVEDKSEKPGDDFLRFVEGAK